MSYAIAGMAWSRARGELEHELLLALEQFEMKTGISIASMSASRPFLDASCCDGRERIMHEALRLTVQFEPEVRS